tara:strand:- start:535 stop:1281 length:747 start_codon:yes stop_codon:yes gene_type:complete
MKLKNLYIVAGSSGLIGSHVCDVYNASNENYLGLDFHKGKHSSIVDLSNQEEFIEAVNKKVDQGITNISLIYSAGKNGSVEYGGLDKFGEYSEKELNEYLYQNTVLPYACSMSLINFIKKRDISLKVLILCSHYSFVAGTDSLYPLSDSGEIQIKPHGYIISKHAAIGVIKSLAATYGSDKVLINGFAPGGVLNNQNKEFIKNFENYAPLKRLAKPLEIAKWIVALSDPELTYSNGSIFNVDGGVLIK